MDLPATATASGILIETHRLTLTRAADRKRDFLPFVRFYLSLCPRTWREHMVLEPRLSSGIATIIVRIVLTYIERPDIRERAKQHQQRAGSSDYRGVIGLHGLPGVMTS